MIRKELHKGRAGNVKWRVVEKAGGKIDVQYVDFRGTWRGLEPDLRTRAPY